MCAEFAAAGDAVSQHGARVLTERDRELLRFIGEQDLVTLPQLAYLAGRSERTARWLRTRWQRAGLIDAARLLVEEPTVVWPTRRGLDLAGLPWPSMRPSYEVVRAVATVVDVRLSARDYYPSAQWVSRRLLGLGRDVSAALPDALLCGGGSRVALIVSRDGVRREWIEDRIATAFAAYESVLVVLVGSDDLPEWAGDQTPRVSVVGYARDSRVVIPPVLPPLPGIERHLPEPSWADDSKRRVDELLRRREQERDEARADAEAFRNRDDPLSRAPH